jgi:hypothetical protein
MRLVRKSIILAGILLSVWKRSLWIAPRHPSKQAQGRNVLPHSSTISRACLSSWKTQRRFQ